MEKKRGFEIAKGFENANINIPVRSTKNSAGYDIEAAENPNLETEILEIGDGLAITRVIKK